MNTKNTLTYSALALMVASFFAACSSKDDDKPSNDIEVGGDSGTAKGGSASKGGASASGGNSAAEGGNTSATAGSTSASGGNTSSAGASSIAGATSGTAGAAGSSSACQRDAAKSCWQCSASATDAPDVVLNRCTDAKCVAFDNTTLAKIVGGKLPPLP